MNTYCGRRRSIPALILCVAMVMAYMIAPMGAADVYAGETIPVYFAANGPDEPLDCTIEIAPEGDYVPGVLSFRYDGEATDDLDQYVMFTVGWGDEFTCTIADKDAYISEDEGERFLEIAPVGEMEPGEYAGVLHVYYDETGQGNFEDCVSESLDICITVKEHEAVSFEMDWPEYEGFYFDELYEGYEPAENGIGFTLLVGACDSEYAGTPLENFVKFEFEGDDAEAFEIAGFDGTKVLDEEEPFEESLEIRPAAGLTPRYYCTTLNMYVDPTGQQDFNEAVRSEYVDLIVQRAPEYQLTVEDEDGSDFSMSLTAGYTAEDAAAAAKAVFVRNSGKNTVEFDPEWLWFHSDDDVFQYDQEELPESVTLAPGDRIKVATLTATPGLEEGFYGGNFIFDEPDPEEWECNAYEAEVKVLHDGAQMTLDTEVGECDFGILQPGFDEFEVGTQGVIIFNSGNKTITVDRIEKPEEGPFREAAYSGEPTLAAGDEFRLEIGLDGDSEYANQNGVYRGTYNVYAVETDEEGTPVEGGEEIVLEVPVCVEITDETFTISVDMQGHGEDFVLRDVLKGTNIRDAVDEAFRDRNPGTEVDDCSFGGFNQKPLSQYKDEETFDEDREEFSEQVLTGDTTVYAVWRPIVNEAVDITVKAPKVGQNADDNPPVVTSSNSRYTVSAYGWMKEYDFPADILEEDGKYYAVCYMKLDFPNALPQNIQSWKVKVNGEPAVKYVNGIGSGWVELQIPFYMHTNGWHKDDGEWRFYKDGTMLTNGWAKDSGGWMWMNASGKITKSQWVKDNGEWYYLKSNGYMAANEWAKDSGGWMWMNASGKITKSQWVKDNGEWYYLKSNGYMAANEWAKDSGGWMWMNASGKITKNKWIKDKGEWYYLKSNGYMAANEWAKDSGGWMYMNASGKITKSKWVKDGGAWYYLKANGYMATGTQTIDGKTYKFDSSGKWIK